MALRDSITKATLEGPAAVIVNITALHVPEESEWSTFISARWQLDAQIDVPIVLVCADRATRDALARRLRRPLPFPPNPQPWPAPTWPQYPNLLPTPVRLPPLPRPTYVRDQMTLPFSNV